MTRTLDLEGTREVAIIGGLRTPFAKQGGPLRSMSALQLGRACVNELLARLDVDPEVVDLLSFGQVIPSIEAPNVAREIVVSSQLSEATPAHTVSKACITSYQTTTDVLQAIETGRIDVGIAGGCESASQVPLVASDALRDALLRARRAGGVGALARAFRGLSLGDLMPETPAVAEYSTGETMGEACERMAKLNGIRREAQDAFAHDSHRKAAAAWDAGHLDDQVMPLHVSPAYETTVERDALVRFDSDPAAYADLPPVFDPDHGTLTAGNSSPLTDGAAALLLMRTERALELGLEPLGFVRSTVTTAVDPAWQLLLAPAWAIPRALDRAGVTLDDVDLVDVHEAFSAAVLSQLAFLEDPDFARDSLGRSEPVGPIRPETLNVDGGSIALGHPFAATGARQILQTLAALRRRDLRTGLCSACAAGGMGAAMVLEVA